MIPFPIFLSTLWIRLYLGAGNDNTARRIARTKLATLSWQSPASSKLLGHAIDSILNEYRTARPYRTDFIGSLIDSYLEGSNRPTSVKDLVNLYSAQASHELFLGDTVAAKLSAQAILSVIEGKPGSTIDADFMRKDAPASIASA